MPYYPPASSGGGYATIKDEGASLPQQTTIDFVGAGVTAADGASKTTVTITGSAGDLSLNKLAPTADVTVTAGYSATVERQFTIASAKKLTIGSGARFRIH